MPVALHAEIVGRSVPKPYTWMLLAAFSSAGLLLSYLLASLGVDLSSGLF
jgi:hypothetical protein